MSRSRKILSILLILGLAVGAIFTTFEFKGSSDADIVIDLNNADQQERIWSETEIEILDLLDDQKEVKIAFRFKGKSLDVYFRGEVSIPRTVEMVVLNLTNDHTFMLNHESLTDAKGRKRLQLFNEITRLAGLQTGLILFEAGTDLTQFDVYTQLEKILPEDHTIAFVPIRGLKSVQ